MKYASLFIITYLCSCALTKKQDYFKNYDGTFVLYEQGKGIIRTVNPELAQEQFSPCSTFKVPHAVFGLESKYITGEDFALEYDPKRNPVKSFWPDNWAQDQNLNSAIRNSVVWYFQNVARNIGPEKMKLYISKSKFGNQDASGGIDTFWLGSSLKISALEQVKFWSTLFNNELGFKRSNVDLVRKIIIEEQTSGYILRGKTGACTQSNNRRSAWWVGSIEQNNKTYYFATLVLGDNFTKMFSDRKEITKSYLKDEGLL